jgi:flagellar protein FliL
MSDASMNDADDLAEGSGKGKKKKGKGSMGGAMVSGLVKILAIVAAIVGAILFIVVISVLTYRVMDKDSQKNILVTLADDVYKIPGNHDYADPIKVRGRTSDRSPRTFMIDVQLGYFPGDEKTVAELARRTPQLQDLLRQYFSSQRMENLTPEREDALKAELRNQVNNILSQGRVTDVIFTEKIIDFG